MSERAGRAKPGAARGLRLEAIDKTFRQGGKAIEVLQGVSL
ncbi:MAG: macrolide ABC transporter ATP-binding protein, partial [Proteobacteria bacterium]|nr:macrolide ABC transporter ATP-binding protein [Pseudomonadota bacterium]